MGVNIYTLNMDNILGAGGFMRLRRRIAELRGGEIAEHYIASLECFPDDISPEHTAIGEGLFNNATHEDRLLMNFLYASDVEGFIGWEAAHVILQLCEQVENEERSDVYGYSAWEDAFTFGDFCDMLRDAVDESCPLWWH